ncbi:MAG: hypothetical protein ACK4XY_03575 [Chloroherpetonaceae bacterium]
MKILIFFLVAFAISACDGKPPEMVEKKIASTARTETKQDENPNSLLSEKWAQSPIWQEGTEERAEYDVERVINGTAVKFSETRLTRKEAFTRQAYSATSDSMRTDLVAVISQHTFAKGERALYSSSLSVLQRDALKITKYIASWSDERGTFTKTLRRLVGRTMLYVHAWQVDNEGKGDSEIDLAKNDFLYDQLPLSLRALNFKEGQEFYWNTLSELLEPSPEKPSPNELHYKIEGLETLTVPAGTFQCWRVSIQSAERDDLFWFNSELPNVMVKAQTEQCSAELRKLDYIKRNLAILNKTKL